MEINTKRHSRSTLSLNSLSFKNSKTTNNFNSYSVNSFENKQSNYQEPVQIKKQLDTTAPIDATQICNFLWLGNLDNAQDTNFLVKNNITHIINISTYDYENGLPPQVNPNNYLHIKILDSDTADLRAHLDVSMKFLKRARILWEDSNSKYGSCLVHCQAGISRSSSLVIAFMMNHRHMGWRRSYDYVKSRRPSICPNMNFNGQLLEYEKELAEKNIIDYRREREYDASSEGLGSQKSYNDNNFNNFHNSDSSFSAAPSEVIPDSFQPINWTQQLPAASPMASTTRTSETNNSRRPRPKFLKISTKYISCMNTKDRSMDDSESTTSSGIGACCGLKKSRPNSLNFSRKSKNVVNNRPTLDSDITPTQEMQDNPIRNHEPQHSSPDSNNFSNLCGISKGAKQIVDYGARTMKRVITRQHPGERNIAGNKSSGNIRARNSQSLSETNHKIINFDEAVVSSSNDNISRNRLHGRKELDGLVLDQPVLQ